MNETQEQVNAVPVRDESMPTPPGAATPRQMKLIKQWSRDVAISMVVAWFIIAFLYQQVRVDGTSMMPGLMTGDRLIINKFIYRFSPLKHGDIVVFLYPGDRKTSYIKRVIGLPGDDVREDDGQIFVNGAKLVEPYIADQYRDDRTVSDVVVPAGEVYVLGDHRNISSDSRDFGAFDRKLIYGKAVYVYWPAKDSGTVR
jgi:signal peptidase I